MDEFGLHPEWVVFRDKWRGLISGKTSDPNWARKAWHYIATRTSNAIKTGRARHLSGPRSSDSSCIGLIDWSIDWLMRYALSIWILIGASVTWRMLSTSTWTVQRCSWFVEPPAVGNSRWPVQTQRSRAIRRTLRSVPKWIRSWLHCKFPTCSG